MTLVLLVKLNCILDIFLCFFTKAFIQCQPVLVACILKFTNRFYFHFFPDGMDLFWSQAFYIEHLYYSRWSTVNIFFQYAQLAGFQHLDNLFSHALTNTLYTENFFRGNVLQLPGQFFNIKSGY